jgi:hypothetical protein
MLLINLILGPEQPLGQCNNRVSAWCEPVSSLDTQKLVDNANGSRWFSAAWMNLETT